MGRCILLAKHQTIRHPQPRQEQRKLHSVSLFEPFYRLPAELEVLCACANLVAIGGGSKMLLKAPLSSSKERPLIVAEAELEDVDTSCIRSIIC
jgi:hypothetical protein